MNDVYETCFITKAYCFHVKYIVLLFQKPQHIIKFGSFSNLTVSIYFDSKKMFWLYVCLFKNKAFKFKYHNKKLNF